MPAPRRKAPFEIDYQGSTNDQLMDWHSKFHAAWNAMRERDSSTIQVEGQPRSPEDILNAHALLVDEMKRRDIEHEIFPGDLDMESKPLEQKKLTIVEPSGVVRGPVITANQVLERLGDGDLILRRDIARAFLRDGVPTIRINAISAELLEELKKILVWRIKRAFTEIPGEGWVIEFEDGKIERENKGRARGIDFKARLQNIRIRHPYVTLVGGLAIHGQTKGDIDFLLKDPPEALPQTEWVYEALNQKLGDLKDRTEFHSEMPYWGPFTDHFELYDLTFKVNEETEKLIEMDDGLYARVYDLVLERLPGNRRIEMSDLDKQSGSFPVMKLPDPAFTVERLSQGQVAGFLSRVDRRARAGKDQVLVNERKGGDAEVSAFAIIKFEIGKPMAALDSLTDRQRAGIDEDSLKEFAVEKDLFYFPLELVRRFANPIPIDPKAPGLRGRRFAGEIDLEADRLEKQLPDGLRQDGRHSPHEANGKHNHKGLPSTTGGHAHGPPDALGAHRHRPGDKKEGHHLNIGSGFHIHNRAQNIEQMPSRKEVIAAHFPAPKWIPDAVATEIRLPGGEWKKTTEQDWDDHAKTPLHNPEMSVEDHLDAFVRKTRVLEKRYILKDGSAIRPGRKEYELERDFFRKMVLTKDVISESRIKIIRRKIKTAFVVQDGLMFTMKNPFDGKPGRARIFVEKQRAPGRAMELAPRGAIDVAVVDEKEGKPDKIAEEFMGRRVFVLQEAATGNKFLGVEILLAIMDPMVNKAEKQRAGGAQIQREAKASEREDRIMPDRFFVPQKPILSVDPGQEQSVPALIDLVKEKDSFPVLVSKKFDGARIIVRKLGDKVEFWTENGTEVTDRLPGMAEAVKKLKGETLVMDGELEWWEGGRHFPRGKVSGYLNSKSEPDDSNLVLNLFDLLYVTGVGDPRGDIHKEAQILRFAILAGSLGMPQRTSGVPKLKDKLNTAPHFEAMNESELRRFIRQESGKPGSEGVVVKISDAPAQVRTDADSEGAWIKFHKHLVVTGLVAEKIETATPNVFVYVYGVEPGDIDPAEPLNVKGRKLAMMGKTFSTSQNLNVGDIIRVESENFVEIRRRDGTTEVNHFAPRVLDPANGKGLSNVPQLRRRARALDILVIKVVQEDGTEIIKAEVYELEIPGKFLQSVENIPDIRPGVKLADVLFRDDTVFPSAVIINKLGLLLPLTEKRRKPEDIKEITTPKPPPPPGSGPLTEIEEVMGKQEDPYLIYPDEDERYKFVWQHHARGNSVHADIRFENQGKRFLVGWTVSVQIAGKIKEPLDTVAKAKAADRVAANWKYDPKTLEVKPRRTRAGVLIPANLQSFKKATQPTVWLRVEGKTEPFPAPGSTRNFPGVFTIQDKGRVEYGRQDPFVHEYFISGGKFKGRVLFRALERRSESVSKDYGDLMDEVDALEKQILPPGNQPEGDEVREAIFWVMIQPVDQRPNVLDAESVEKGFRTPLGISALPESVRKKIPEPFRYWEAKDTRTKNRRLVAGPEG